MVVLTLSQPSNSLTDFSEIFLSVPIKTGTTSRFYIDSASRIPRNPCR